MAQKKGNGFTRFIGKLFKTFLVILVIALIRGGFTELGNFIGSKTIPYQEITIEETELTDRYYYNSLSEDSLARTVYKEILQGLLAQDEKIYLHYDVLEGRDYLLECVLNDWPEIFWFDYDGQWRRVEEHGETYEILEPEYEYVKEEVARMEQRMEPTIDEYLSGISKNASDYEKILYVYESLINNVEYVADSMDNQNIYSAFTVEKTVCAGYAKATQYLLQRLGVECLYVSGWAGADQGAHAWNVVKCDGQYYFVDTTWGDGTFQAEEYGEVTEYINYDYMCCSGQELFVTHTLDNAENIPDCTSMERNYYVMNGMYYTEYDKDAILNVMYADVDARKPETVIKFANNELYGAAKEEVADSVAEQAAVRIRDSLGLNRVGWSYLQDDEFNKVVLYWQYEEYVEAAQ